MPTDDIKSDSMQLVLSLSSQVRSDTVRRSYQRFIQEEMRNLRYDVPSGIEQGKVLPGM